MGIKDRDTFQVWVEVEKTPKFEEVARQGMPWSNCVTFSIHLVSPGLITLDPRLAWEEFCDRYGFDNEIREDFTWKPQVVDGKVEFQIVERRSA